MTAAPAVGRLAISHYQTVDSFEDASLLRVRIETGRTHQIRVHLAHIGHPVIGDPDYGRARGRILPVPVHRQLLHAETLSFQHPRTGLKLEFHAPLPADFRAALTALRHAG